MVASDRLVNPMRQVGILHPPALARHVDLVGCGGIGSAVAFVLAKMAAGSPDFELRLIDGDRVEDINVPNQCFNRDDVRYHRYKATAMQRHVRNFAGLEAEAVTKYLMPGDPFDLHDVVILTVDSLTARRDIYEASVRGNAAIEWFLDARMGAEMGTILTYPADALADYPETLRGVPVRLPCTAKAIAYNTSWIAALVARNVKRIMMDQPVERQIDFDLNDLTLLVEE